MNDVQIFNNPEFGEIRTVMLEGEPWFAGKDVAIALGYVKPVQAIHNNVDKDDSLRKGLIDSCGREQETICINESGLYSLIFGSKLESAKKFKKWVTSEVLPSIRKNGSYSQPQLPQTTDGKIALLAQGHVELKEEIDGVKADLEALKMDLPILPVEADRITEAVRKKGVSILGGKQSPAYNDRGLRQRLYNNLYANLKYNFGTRTYKSIKRSQTDAAIAVIQRYQPPFILAEEIDNVNAQMTLDAVMG